MTVHHQGAGGANNLAGEGSTQRGAGELPSSSVPIGIEMMSDIHGASPDGDRAVAATPSSPAVSPVPASIPRAPRPTRYDDAIVLSAAKEVAAACVEWDEGNSEPSDWINDLVKCRSRWDDGYKLAKALEDRCGVDADMDLAERLDDAGHALWTAHEAAIRQWVADYGITPTLPVGTRVRTSGRGDGVIGSIDLQRAIYLVIPDGEEEKFARGGGMCIPYEDASAIEAAAAGETREAGLDPKDESAVPEADAYTGAAQ